MKKEDTEHLIQTLRDSVAVYKEASIAQKAKAEGLQIRLNKLKARVETLERTYTYWYKRSTEAEYLAQNLLRLMAKSDQKRKKRGREMRFNGEMLIPLSWSFLQKIPVWIKHLYKGTLYRGII